MKNFLWLLWCIFAIFTALAIMTVEFLAGIIMLCAGLLAVPQVRRKLNMPSTKIFGISVLLYIIGFITALALTETPEQPKSETGTQEISTVQDDEQPKDTDKLVAKPTTPVVVAVPTPVIDEPIIKESNYDLTCKIVGVSDGDTATCLTDDKTQIKIRLDQIDAPEQGQAFGNAAKQTLSTHIYQKEVGLKTKETDKYGRTVAEVFINDKNINKEMVSLGMAWAYREYIKDNEYLSIEDKARRASVGIWSEPNPIYPSDFRRGKRGEQSSPVQTQQIAQVQEKRDLVDSGGKCGSKRTCKAMSSCAEAKHYLHVCGVSRLDRDGDGVPCESLCR
ncbi:thermonuclease family protein [Moraxella bovoculi]|uniref:thermonuclease family protein n=1 Tax=Moraxella bovoculi TaxID=386891 RepID=UPI0009B966DB|nr:thermonuclease family protein [Moraxella bovoculi]